MSTATVRLRTDALRARLARIRTRLPDVLEERMKRIAAEVVEQIDVEGSWRGGRGYNALRSLSARFVPVTLKHVRREQWPDVAGLYYGRVPWVTRNGVKVKRVWVDAAKLADLRQRIIQRLARQIKDPSQWKISVAAHRESVRVEIVKQGRASKRDRQIAEALTRQIKAMFAEQASATLYEALSG